MRVTESGDWIRVVTRHVGKVSAVSGWGMAILSLLLLVRVAVHMAKQRALAA